jgi:hypothetical protein
VVLDQHDPGNAISAHRGSVAPSEPSTLYPSHHQRTPNHPLLRLLYEQTIVLPFMSQSNPMASSSSSSNFQLIINNALDLYKKRTKNDLVSHPLAAQLQFSKSPSQILAVLQQQVQGLDQSKRSDERWTRWVDPTVNVLYTLSETLGEGVGLVRLRT